jgi:hypothetical protein
MIRLWEHEHVRVWLGVAVLSSAYSIPNNIQLQSYQRVCLALGSQAQ